MKRKAAVRKPQAKKQAASKGVTFVSLVLDETGSMADCRGATVSGFNEYIKTLKTRKDPVKFTLTLFNTNKTEIRHRCVPLEMVRELNNLNYIPDACTNLYDAVAAAIRAMEGDIASVSPKPAVLCVIMTDGQENSSKEYDYDKIRDLIQEKEKDGWNFVYLGANQDAWAVGTSLGIAAHNTMSYKPSDTKHVAAFVGLVTNNYRGQSGGVSMKHSSLVSDTLAKNKKEFEDLDEFDKATSGTGTAWPAGQPSTTRK